MTATHIDTTYKRDLTPHGKYSKNVKTKKMQKA